MVFYIFLFISFFFFCYISSYQIALCVGGNVLNRLSPPTGGYHPNFPYTQVIYFDFSYETSVFPPIIDF